jgi:hypothetical protein
MARFNLQTLDAQAWMNMIVQYVWDSQPVGAAAGGPTTLPFFLNNAQTVNTNVAKTLVDTNMPQPGFFPSPDSYYVTGFMVQALPRSPAAAAYLLTDATDQSRFFDQGIFQLFVGSNTGKICEGHAQVFPCGLGQQGMVTTGGATASNVAYVLGNGVRQIANAYNLTDQFAEKVNSGEKLLGQIVFPTGALSCSNTFTARAYLRGLWNQSVR